MFLDQGGVVWVGFANNEGGGEEQKNKQEYTIYIKGRERVTPEGVGWVGEQAGIIQAIPDSQCQPLLKITKTGRRQRQ